LWQTVGRFVPEQGWSPDWDALRLAAPAETLADDEERQELMRAMRLCAAVLNGGARGMLKGDATDDGDRT
jgi:hypothetical protein